MWNAFKAMLGLQPPAAIWIQEQSHVVYAVVHLQLERVNKRSASDWGQHTTSVCGYICGVAEQLCSQQGMKGRAAELSTLVLCEMANLPFDAARSELRRLQAASDPDYVVGHRLGWKDGANRKDTAPVGLSELIQMLDEVVESAGEARVEPEQPVHSASAEPRSESGSARSQGQELRPEALEWLVREAGAVVALLEPQLLDGKKETFTNWGEDRPLIIGYVAGAVESLCASLDLISNTTIMAALVLSKIAHEPLEPDVIYDALLSLADSEDEDYRRAKIFGRLDLEAVASAAKPEGLTELLGKLGEDPHESLSPERPPLRAEPPMQFGGWRVDRVIELVASALNAQLQAAGVNDDAWIFRDSSRTAVLGYAVGLSFGLSDLLNKGDSRRLVAISMAGRLDRYSSNQKLSEDLKSPEEGESGVAFRAGYADAKGIYGALPGKWLSGELVFREELRRPFS
jgi:hypothetical protein